MRKQNLNYKKAGVNIDEGNRLVKEIRPLLRKTYRKEVIGDIGGFGGLFRATLDKYKKPILVSSTDGVGTKIIIAKMAGRYDTVGIDLVAMSVNDLIVQGAEPLFFLDYIAVGKLHWEKAKAMIKGVVRGCQESGCALIGGETAEMPGVYQKDDFDMAGFAVGVVDEDELITGEDIREGNLIIGLASNGLHSNGFSLVRKLFFEKLKYEINRYVPALKTKLSDELLRPTAIYVKTVLSLNEKFKIKGIAHITGGGFYDNIERILPEGKTAIINKKSWLKPPIFSVIQKEAKISDYEMYRTFNMGIGMVLVIDRKNELKIMTALKKMKVKAFSMGEIIKGKKEVKLI